MIGQGQPRNEPHHPKKRDCEPHGRTVLLGSPIPLLSTWAPLPNKVSCFVSMCVSSDNSFPNVRQEPTLGYWKGSLFLQQKFKMRVPSAQSCPILCNLMDCSPPSSFVHGIFQVRLLEYVAFPPPGDLPNPGIELESPVSLTLQADSLPTEPSIKSSLEHTPFHFFPSIFL